MAKVIYIADYLPNKEASPEEPVENPTGLLDSMKRIMAINKLNKEREAEDRARANGDVIRSHRLKPGGKR